MRASFGGDGRTAVTAGEDGRVIVWDVRRAASGETLQGHAGEISGLAISRDGGTLYTSGVDGNVLVWDLTGNRRLSRAVKIGRGATDAEPGSHLPVAATSPDGRVLALGLGDGTISLVDARTLRTRSSFRVVPSGPVANPGVRAGQPAARGRRRRRLPRPCRPAPEDDRQAAARPFREAAQHEHQRRWTGHGLRRRLRRGHPDLGAAVGPAGRSPAGQADRALRRRGARAQPRRADSGGPGSPRATSRSWMCAPGGAARRCLGPGNVLFGLRFTPDGRFLMGSDSERLGAAVVDCDLATRRPGAARAERRGLLAGREPGQPHPGHRQHGRDTAALRPAHAAAGRCPAARRPQPSGGSLVHA